MAAHRQREMRNFLQLALAAALEVEDCARVRGCRARMEERDRARLRGKSIRAGVTPVLGGHEYLLFLEGAERRRGGIVTDPSKVETRNCWLL
jgi:hypothetical protein